jgi:hypothetical protein
VTQRWDPWVRVETGLAQTTPALPSGPLPLKTQVVPESYDTQEGVRALLVGLFFAALAGYHGYQRNKSLAWAAPWAVAGFVCPVVTLPFAISQGYGKRKG